MLEVSSQVKGNEAGGGGGGELLLPLVTPARRVTLGGAVDCRWVLWGHPEF